MSLSELAGRCERAAAPDRNLDSDIMRALGMSDLQADYAPTPFTASLDAAVTLVPDGWRWIMRQATPDKLNPHEKGFFARLESSDFKSITWGKGGNYITDIVSGQEAMSWSATPALALCAAALRARDAIAAATRTAETRSKAPGEASQSVIAQSPSQ